MPMETKVSVIIPVYNPGEWLRKCAESLTEQSLKEIELLFVDDGCTDGSAEYIRSLALSDPRIRLITNRENIGPGRSRNRGIMEARGEYLAFVDADDYVSPDFLECLYTAAVAEQADIAKGLHCCVDLNGNRSTGKSAEMNRRLREAAGQGSPFYLIFTTDHQSALYRRDMLISNHAFYGTSGNAEDTFFLLQASFAAEKICFAEQAVYYYMERVGSRFRNLSVGRIEAELVSLQEMMRFAVAHDLNSRADIAHLGGHTGVVLGYVNALKAKEGGDQNTDRISAEIRDIFQDYPWKDELVEISSIMDSFLTEGVNLAPVPDMIRGVPFDWLCGNAEDWIRYLHRHAARMEISAWYLDSAVKKVALFPGNRKDKKEKMSSLRKMASGLPLNDTALNHFLKLKLFIFTGLNLYGMGNTGAGRLISRLLKSGRR